MGVKPVVKPDVPLLVSLGNDAISKCLNITFPFKFLNKMYWGYN